MSEENKPKRNGNKPKYTTEQVIEALKATRGTVVLAADYLGCVPKTMYNYINQHPSVKQAQEDASERFNDWAEVKLFDRIMAGDIAAIKYRLSTRAKDRGYGLEGNLNVKHDYGVMEVPDVIDAEFWDVTVTRHIKQVGNENGNADSLESE